MDGGMTSDVVVEPPAVDLFCALHRDGFTVALTANDVLTVSPRSRLTAERMRLIQAYKEPLKRLVRPGDDGVLARRDAFVEQVARTLPSRVPAFLFLANIAYVAGIRFSCGDPLPSLSFARCWRCAVAWRLAWPVRVGEESARFRVSSRRLNDAINYCCTLHVQVQDQIADAVAGRVRSYLFAKWRRSGNPLASSGRSRNVLQDITRRIRSKVAANGGKTSDRHKGDRNDDGSFAAPRNHLLAASGRTSCERVPSAPRWSGFSNPLAHQ
jgi:hypothetical protein